MPLDTAQITWLNQVTKAGLPLPDTTQPGSEKGLSAKELQATLRARLDEEVMRDEKRKAMALSDAQRTIKPLKPVLQEAFNLQVTYDSGKTEQLQAKSGDLSEAVEVRDVKGKAQVGKSGSTGPVSQKDEMALLSEAKKAYDVVLTLRTQLEGMTTVRSRIAPDGSFFDGEPEPLFSTAEIIDEVFTPLVRQKILPETIITDGYSAVQKMLDGSNALYKEELKEAENPKTSVELLKMAVDLGSDITGAVLKIVGVDTDLAKAMLEGSTELVKLTCDFGEKLANGADVKSVTDFLDGLPSVIGSMVGAALDNEELGDLIGGAGEAGTKAIALIANSIKERKPVPSAVIDFVSSIISVGLGRIDSSTDKGEAAVTFGDDLQQALAGVASSHADAFFEDVFAGDMDKARQEMFGVIKDVVLTLPSLAKDTRDLATAGDQPKSKDDSDQSDDSEDDPLGDALESTGEQVDTVKEEVEKQLEEREKLLEKLDGAGGEKLKALSENVDKAAEDRKKLEADPVVFAKSVEEELKKEQEEFKKELQGLGDVLATEKTIEKLMAKIQRDRAIMSVAVVIGKGGFEVASKFFAPLSMGTEAIKMAANIAAAAQRAQDLRKFLEMQKRSKNAVSPYLTSVQNFVDNQANQLTQYAIRVALNGAAIAAAAAATAFPLAAPAVAITAVVQSESELLFQVYDEKRLKDAWTLTKSALDDPSNRKLGLRARKLNPTLAKYTIAYGAEVAHDPIALNMCQECGLSLETVANADAKKIKAYLVLRFDKDGEVVEKFDDPQDWQADLPEPKLAPDCVFATYAIMKDAEEKHLFKGKASGDLKPPSDLVALVRAVAKDLPTGATPEELEARLVLLGRVQDGFRAEAARMAPLGDGAGSTIEAFAGIAEVQANKLVMELLKAKVTAAGGKK
jgi:hypothetical protein